MSLGTITSHTELLFRQDIARKKLSAGWLGVGGGGWVVFVKDKDRSELINKRLSNNSVIH